MAEILRAHTWPSNAALIADVARLGYLRQEAVTLDPTYGEGKWWATFRPDTLICHDLYKLDGVDFRALPEEDDAVEAVAFDPPYVSTGGRKTSTIPKFNHAYGIGGESPSTPAKLQALINAGFPEFRRVLGPKGILLVKCQDYVSSGQMWWGTDKTRAAAVRSGFREIDRFIHLGGPGAQPKNRTRKGLNGKRIPTVQQHTRSNYSVLFVFQAPGVRRVSR